MIFCFASPVTINLVVVVFPLIVRSRLTNSVINPVLFFVPSTFRAINGSLSVWVSRPAVFA
jgi:hypothetical protein